MEMFSMLKHSIIPDNINPINDYFDIGRQTGSAGPEMVWKIFEAVRKEDKKVRECFGKGLLVCV
jgi:SCY1-like protein 2